MSELGSDGRIVMPKKKRRQHHVWQRYLKPWVIGGNIHVLRAGTIKPTGTNNVAVERDFYKLHKLSSDDLTWIELLAMSKLQPIIQEAHKRFLNRLQEPMRFVERNRPLIANPEEVDAYIEIYMNNILEDAHSGIENSFLPLLDVIERGDMSFYRDDDESIKFLHFISVQYMRTKGIKERSIKIVKEADGLDMTKFWDIICYLFACNIGRSLYIERKVRKLALIENRTDIAFITGDQPIINLYSTGYTTPVTKLSYFYPISPGTALILGEVGEDLMFTSETLTASEVADLNARMAGNSHEQVFGDSEDALRPFL